MKTNIYKSFTLAAAVCLLAAGCAKENTINTGEKAQEYLKLYIEKYYPYVTPNEYGLYVLDETPGTGSVWKDDIPYVYTRTTVRNLSGTITSTTEETVAQQLGTYTKGNYYGPKYQQIGQDYSYVGLDYLLKGMRVGGTRTAIIPSWQLTTSRYSTTKEYIDACSTDTHLEYTVTLEGMSPDIAATEKDSLTNYVLHNYGPGHAPTTIASDVTEGTFYFISDSTAFIGKPYFPSDTTVHLNYTGRLLNGQVFDTTIERVAKDAGIYSASKTYGPVSVTFASKYTEVKMGESSSLITGFKGGLYKLRWLGQKADALFTSELGYTTTGSGQTIPPYSPLLFELEVVKE
jgi:FKBP-type peptidyl-prolyl cis-trans isomerase 2